LALGRPTRAAAHRKAVKAMKDGFLSIRTLIYRL
jgi:hypothetical protein